jgi:hypothetical protein
VSLRGEAQRAAIRSVLDAFGPDSSISTLTPVLQEKKLADMCSRGLLNPDPEVQCRYRIRGTEVDVDVLSPEGFNVVKRTFGGAQASGRSAEVAYVSPAGVAFGCTERSGVPPESNERWRGQQRRWRCDLAAVSPAGVEPALAT